MSHVTRWARTWSCSWTVTDYNPAVNNSTALLVLPQRTLLEFTGRDRATFLHNFTTNDIKALTPGQGCEAFAANIKGRIIAHLWIFVTENAIRVDAAPGMGPALLKHFDKYIITEDVQIADRSESRQSGLLVGPTAAELIAACGGATPAKSMGSYTCTGPLEISRVDWTVPDCFLVTCAKDAADAVWKSFQVAGAVRADERWEALRIAHGYPQDGVDLSGEMLVHEANRTPQTVSFRKGCYLGQEPIARLDALGHANRLLQTLELTGERPQPGTIVQDTDGQDLGRVTSSATDPRTGLSHALALLKRTATAGTVVFWEGQRQGVVQKTA